MKAIQKNFKSCALLVVLIFTVSSTAFAQTISVSNAIAEPNEEFEIKISIENSLKKIECLGLDLTFDNNVVSYVDYELGELLVNFYDARAVLIKNDTLRIGGFSIYPIEENSSGDLIILTFKVNNAAYDFDFTLSNLEDDVKNHEIIAGQFKKYSQPVTPPTSPPASGSTLFGGSTGGGALFGGSTSSGGSTLFGGSTGGSTLFGGSSAGGSTLFGGTSGGSTLFGGSTSGGSTLFGGSTSGGSALFGGSTSSGSTLFGGSTSGGSALFGGTSGGSTLFGGSTGGSTLFGGSSGGSFASPPLLSTQFLFSPW